MKEAHRNGFGVDCRQRPEIEWLELSLRPDATAHTVRALERYKRLGPGRARAIQLRTRLAPQVQEMLEARVGDERGTGSLALEQCVGRNGRAVREPLDEAGGTRGSRSRDDRLLLERSGEDLGRGDAAAVEYHRVGEGPAHVDAEHSHSGRLTA